MSGLLTLAEACEKAGGPDRELDFAIFRLISNVPDDARQFGERLQWARQQANGKWLTLSEVPPAYTASIDAAMTLVPKGWVIGSLDWWPSRREAGVALLETSEHDHNGFASHGYDAATNADARAKAPTPALALCAASLRARASK